MSEDRHKVEAFYGGKLRVRVCGMLKRVNDGALLCALHQGVGPLGSLWVPPGGGLAFGETIAECLKREFLEETHLHIEVGKLYNVYEYVQPPLHAVELFYEVTLAQPGQPHLGTDPEWPTQHPPLLQDLAWITPADCLADDRLKYHRVVWDVMGA